MSNYHLLTDVLYHQDGVVARKKNPVFPLVVVAAGIGLSIWSLNAPALEDSKNLSASLMLVGGVVALLGLIRLVMAFTGKKPVYGPTGETFSRRRTDRRCWRLSRPETWKKSSGSRTATAPMCC